MGSYLLTLDTDYSFHSLKRQAQLVQIVQSSQIHPLHMEMMWVAPLILHHVYATRNTQVKSLVQACKMKKYMHVSAKHHEESHTHKKMRSYFNVLIATLASREESFTSQAFLNQPCPNNLVEYVSGEAEKISISWSELHVGKDIVCHFAIGSQSFSWISYGLEMSLSWYLLLSVVLSSSSTSNSCILPSRVWSGSMKYTLFVDIILPLVFRSRSACLRSLVLVLVLIVIYLSSFLRLPWYEFGERWRGDRRDEWFRGWCNSSNE